MDKQQPSIAALGNFGVYMKYRYGVQQYTDISALLSPAMRAEKSEQLDRISDWR